MSDDRRQRVERGLLFGNVAVAAPPASITEQMARYDVPGVSVAVIDAGEIAWAHGYGVRDVEAGGAVGVDTLFQAASISKPTTALGVMTLVEQGRLDLDADVNDVLRSWKVPPRDGWQPRLTLRQILCHGAGLTQHGFPGYSVGTALPTLPQILDGAPPANTMPVRVDTLPGAHFRYSGGGTTIVQQVIEDVTGEPFADFMRRAVLEPLGMSRSGYLQPLPDALWNDAATAHRVDGTPVRGRAHVYPERAAAGLWTTASDLARMGLATQRAWNGADDGVLRAASVREMLTPQVEDTIGIGFFLDGHGASARFSHSGGNVGFGCLLVAYKERGQGAAVMTNSDWGIDIIEEIMASIARAYEWPDYPRARGHSDAPPVDVLRCAGVYEVRRLRLEAHAEAGRLKLVVAGQAPLTLESTGGMLFTAPPLEVEIEFVEQAGQVVALLLRQNGREERAERL